MGVQHGYQVNDDNELVVEIGNPEDISGGGGGGTVAKDTGVVDADTQRVTIGTDDEVAVDIEAIRALLAGTIKVDDDASQLILTAIETAVEGILATNLDQIEGQNVEVAGNGRIEVGTRRIVNGLIDGSGTTVAIQTVAVNATADGDNVAITNPGAGSIWILGYKLQLTGAGTAQLESEGDVVEGYVSAAAAQEGAVFVGSIDCPALILNAGEDFEIQCPAGVDVLGHVTYIIVS